MSKSLFRRAGISAATALVAATVTATTVLFGGAANAATGSGSNGSAATVSDTVRAKVAELAAKSRKNLTKARGAKAEFASDSLSFGDITGDGKPDLGAVDKTGTLWIYPGTGYVYPGTGPRSKAVFGVRFSVGKGWGAFTTIVKHGDFNGDGKTDLLTRNAAGALFFYEGTGVAPVVFKKAVQVGRSWQTFKSIVGTGDLNGDGNDDLIAQKTNGDLLLYRGTGNGVSPLAGSPATIATGFTGGLLTSLGDITGDGISEFWYRDTSNELWLYPSQAGANPIDTADRIDAGNFTGVRQIAVVGNVYSDAGFEPLPDLLIQVNNTLIVSGPDMGDGTDADFSLGGGWDALTIF